MPKKKYKGKEYNLGGFLKKALPVAGSIASLAIPGVGPLGAMAINAGTGALSNALPGGEEASIGSTPTYTGNPLLGRRSYNQGFRGGGKLKGKKFIGPSHEQGGITLSTGEEVEGGETMDYIQLQKGGKVTNEGQPYVFSKTLKVPGSNMSFAKYHERLNKMKAPKESIRKLAMEQERVSGRVNKSSSSMKANPARTSSQIQKDVAGPSYRKGSMLYKKRTGGGLGGVDLSTMTVGNGGSGPVDVGGIATRGMPTTDVGRFIQNAGNFLKKDSTVDAALNLAPDVMNLASGVFGKDKTPAPTKVSRGSLNNYPTRYNINPLLQSNTSNYRTITNDRGASRATKLAAFSQKLGADSSAYATKANQENQLLAQKSGLQANLDSQQAGFDAQARQDKMISEANLGLSGNFAKQSLSSIASKILQMRGDKNLTERDRELMNMIIEGYGSGEGHTNFLRGLS